MVTNKNSLNRTKRNDGSYIFSDFSNGLYLLDTPRGLGSQLASLAMLGGRNVWSENGALIPQYGYIDKGAIDSDDKVVAITEDSQSASNTFVLTVLGNIYLYTASQGLKRFKTKFDSIADKPLTTRRGNEMICVVSGFNYLFGGYYNDSEHVVINSDVPIADFTTYYELLIPETDKDYYWNGKQLVLNGSDRVTVTAVVEDINSDKITVRCATTDNQHKVYTGNVTVGEKCKLPITFQYEPEDTAIPKKNINPILLGSASNRLFIVDQSGDIYYSQIGNVDSFKEKYGAGYFGDFYNDTSKTLAIEDFLTGALIFKETGVYYLTIASGNTSSVSSSTATNAVNITKIAQVGQQYASDHVIVREKVYCYDSNSGQIVLAVQQNVFGSLVAGKTIISAEYLGAQDMGIQNTKRYMTYNNEAEVLILYYGEELNKGIVLTSIGTLFPRELDTPMIGYLGFNQGVLGLTTDGHIVQDFKKGTLIRNIKPHVDFEAIGLRDNRIICSTILEVTELNGVEYDVQTINTSASNQHIIPVTSLADNNRLLPPMLYSEYDKNNIYNSFSLDSKWAEKKSNLTRVYAPMSGRNGVSISLEFPEDVAFCLAALRLPDFSQGE